MITAGQCPIPVAQQPALILALEREISTAIRETATARGGGLSGGNERDGSTVMSWDYSSDGFDGSGYLVATHAGADFHVVIILSEQLAA